MTCLFCNNEEPNKSFNSHNQKVEFICSSCVQILLGLEQCDLKKAMELAEAKGFKNKVSALKSFLIEDEDNVRKTKKLKRDMVRKRTVQSARPPRY